MWSISAYLKSWQEGILWRVGGSKWRLGGQLNTLPRRMQRNFKTNSPNNKDNNEEQLMRIYFSDSFGGNCRASTKRKRLFVGEGVAPRVLPRPTLDCHELVDRPRCPCNFHRTSAHFIYDEFLDSLRSKGLNIVPQCFHPFSHSGNHLSCFTSYNCVARPPPLPPWPGPLKAYGSW